MCVCLSCVLVSLYCTLCGRRDSSGFGLTRSSKEFVSTGLFLRVRLDLWLVRLSQGQRDSPREGGDWAKQLVTHLRGLLSGAAGKPKEKEGEQQNELGGPDEGKHLGAQVGLVELALGLGVAGGGQGGGNGPEEDGDGVGGDGQCGAQTRAQRKERHKQSDDSEEERNQVEGEGEPGQVVPLVGANELLGDALFGAKVSHGVKREVGLVLGALEVLVVSGHAAEVVGGPSGEVVSPGDVGGFRLQPVEVVEGGRVSRAGKQHEEGQQGGSCNQQDGEGANQGSENHCRGGLWMKMGVSVGWCKCKCKSRTMDEVLDNVSGKFSNAQKTGGPGGIYLVRPCTYRQALAQRATGGSLCGKQQSEADCMRL